jgi:fructuronate reductase
MKLNKAELQNREAWEKAGFRLPQYDIEQVTEQTRKTPHWIHFGAGNIFRAFTAKMQQEILNAGKADTGIIAVGNDIMEKIYWPHDNLGVAVTLRADGSIEKDVIASVVETLMLDAQNASQWNRLTEIFCNPSLQMASFTITEKGYSITGADGEYLPEVAADFANGPVGCASYLGKVAALLYARYQAGKYPIAMQSMDNCSHNGDKLHAAIRAFAEHWKDEGFAAYINDRSCVTFPWSMIDKITPRPDDNVRQMLLDCGFEDVDMVITGRHTYASPFVNAEEAQYLVIEDAFPNGRPNLEEGGVIFTDRETVDKVEKMKVCTCLNPLHTSLAVFGCLLGFSKIYEEMRDDDLRKLVEIIGYQEGLPVVVDPGILSPKAFIDEVLQKRVPNPFMPDTPQRIATDTSQKIPVRFGETIKAYQAREDLDPKDLKLIPLVLAGWCRYLMAIDDAGNPMELSTDPMLESVCPLVAGIRLGEERSFHEELSPILSNDRIFGVNLYEAGLGEKVEGYFAELVKGPGAVRATLHKYVEQ